MTKPKSGNSGWLVAGVQACSKYRRAFPVQGIIGDYGNTVPFFISGQVFDRAPGRARSRRSGWCTRCSSAWCCSQPCLDAGKARGHGAPGAPKRPRGAVQWRAYSMALLVTPAGLFNLAPEARFARSAPGGHRAVAPGPGAGALRGDKPAIRIEGDVQLAARSTGW
jgi:hypothetical protein